MDEDFRAKNIGQPCTKYLGRRDYSQISAKVILLNRQFEKERAERLKGRVYRPIFGARFSRDHGKNWKLSALCDECIKSFEPPAMLKNEGAAGAGNCDFCGALNEMYRK